MSNIQPKRAYAKEIIERFAGLDANGKKQASAIGSFTNLRISPDGKPEKRNGWHLMEEFADNLRGACSFDIDGISICLAVTKNVIYLYAEDEGGFSIPSALDDSDTPVQFVLYKTDLYLLDRNHVLMLCEDGFQRAVGYVPLYGLGWHPKTMGEVLEEPNLLMPKLRINYYNPDLERVLYLPYYSERIDCVMVDGKQVTDFTYGSSSKMIVLNTTGTEIDVAYTYYRDGPIEDAFQQSRFAIVDDVANEEVLILGGAMVEKPMLFMGGTVNDARFAGSQLYYPESRPLYFRSEHSCPFGSFLSPLNAVYKGNANHLLAFTKNQSFSISLSTDGAKVMSSVLINGRVGCAACSMQAFIDGDPLILNETGLLRVHLNAQGELETNLIPCPYPELIAHDFAENAMVCQNLSQNELWLRDRRDPDGTVLVYNTLQQVWYRFRGIHADFLFPYMGTVGICAQNRLGKFTVGCYTDGNQAIEAAYSTDFLDFGEPEVPKRALRFSMTAVTDGSPVKVTLETEARTREIELRGKAASAPDYFDVRAAMGRFRHLCVRVSHSGNGEFCLKRLALFANL